jgi:hypothetical protein
MSQASHPFPERDNGDNGLHTRTNGAVERTGLWPSYADDEPDPPTPFELVST